MENDLVSIYEQNYLMPQNSAGNSSRVIKEEKEDYEENEEGTMPKVPAAKKKKKMSKEEIGATLYDESNCFEKALKSFMEEFDMGDNAFSDEHDADNTFSFEDGEEGEEEAKDSYTIEELKAMTLAEIADLIADKSDFDFQDDEEMPTESMHYGNERVRDGKPSKSETTRVKANGDADFSKQKTGFAPEDTEGSEGSNLGNEQTRDGKPSTNAGTTRVKANGDADFSKQKTGFGKKQNERLF
jgi:hypothetical protein